MTIYSGFSHKKWWFSIAFCMFTRPGKWVPQPPWSHVAQGASTGWRLWSWVPLRPWRTAFCGSGRCCQVGVETPRNGGWVSPGWTIRNGGFLLGVPKKERDHRIFCWFSEDFFEMNTSGWGFFRWGRGGLFFGGLEEFLPSTLGPVSANQ